MQGVWTICESSSAGGFQAFHEGTHGQCLSAYQSLLVVANVVTDPPAFFSSICIGLLQDLCRKYNIPTAQYEVFDNAELAKEYIRKQAAPVVVKADGLAAGKGVIVASTSEEACAAVDDMLINKAFGSAGMLWHWISAICPSRPFCFLQAVSTFMILALTHA